MNKLGRSLFIDSSNLEEIKAWNATGAIDGVTTNQLIMLKDGHKFAQILTLIKSICKEMGSKPVSVELTDSTKTAREMLEEAKQYAKLASNIVVKVPLIPETLKSLEVIHSLIKLNIPVNVTAMMTFEQMVLASLATRNSKQLCFVSLFWARSLEDHQRYRSKKSFINKYPKLGMESEINSHPKKIVENLSGFLRSGNYPNPKIIVGSVRSASTVGEAFAAGANIVTVTTEVLKAMLFSQRSIETIAEFDSAWIKIKEGK